MKSTYLAIIITFSIYSLGAQTSNITFLSNNSENSIYKVSINSNFISNSYNSKHEINNIDEGEYNIKIIFDNAQFSNITETINIKKNYNYTYVVKPSENSKIFLLATDSIFNLFPTIDTSDIINADTVSQTNNIDLSDPTIVRLDSNKIESDTNKTNISNNNNIHNNNTDFASLLNKVETSSRSKRYDVIEEIISNNSLSCSQSISLINNLVFEEDKLRISKIAIAKVNDKNNIDLFIDIFKLPSSKQEMQDYISNHK